MKKILFYMSQDPLPVSNGVTVVVSGMSDSLSKSHDVYVFNYSSRSLYKYEDGVIYLIEQSDYVFDLIICTPILGILNFYRKDFRKFKYNKKLAWLNDNYTNVVISNYLLAARFNCLDSDEIKGLVKVPLIYLAESILCNLVDHVIVQTKRDKELYKWQPVRQKRIHCLPNGIQFDTPTDLYRFKRTGVGFVASFNRKYIKIALWFIENVWSRIVMHEPGIKLHILGRFKNEFYERISKDFPELSDSIVVEEYYSDLSEFYLRRKIVVSPIFKNYGLINKTIEAMQCGCLVVGDQAAFNGIDGFRNKYHGLTCNDEDEFVDGILKLIRHDYDEKIGLAASRLIESSFSWDKNAEYITKNIICERVK